MAVAPVKRGAPGRGWVHFALAAVLLLTVSQAVAIGPASLTLSEVWSSAADGVGLRSWGSTALQAHIVWELRLPRVFTAGIVGAGLSLVGAVMQSLTRNPMADPYLFGVSSGATLGAVLVLVAGVGSGTLALTAGAFIGAMAVFALVVLFSTRRGALAPGRMILAGIALSQFCGSITSFVIVWVGDPQRTQSVTYWLSGSMARARWDSLAAVAVVFFVVAAVFLSHSRSLNAFAFGEQTAVALGVSVNRTRWVLMALGALLTASLVSVSGAIGFVGLILPHAVRFLTGPDERRLLPAAAMAGAVFMIWVDTLARTVFEPREIPVGILTAAVGVPVFIVLMLRRFREGDTV
ncbi:FecCD family ABC transporter permease [Salininema proteolyticum]|uniref:FecCD family ABC transporter permease n=1 Tax=Salininema proteolyticum TaxID=1607685 RepID=A0ABV8TW50_9ACTN